MPKNPKRTTDPGSREAITCGGFTFVELVVAMAIGAAVIVVAVMAYGAISEAGPTRRQADITLPGTTSIRLYGTNIPLIGVSEAPSFAAAAMAESMRERLLGDIASASAVCCLARNQANAAGRPTSLPLPTNFDVRNMVSPDNFRTNLIEPTPNTYSSYTGAMTNLNMSIFILGTSGTSTNVLVKAIYESDFVTLTNNTPGVYASVRRWVGTTMTDYYHVFYPGQANTFSPNAVFFENESLGATGTNAVDRYRKAEERPFYFVWWPDPSRANLDSDYKPPEAQTNAASPRFNTSGMAGATSFFFVIPAFPPL